MQKGQLLNAPLNVAGRSARPIDGKRHMGFLRVTTTTKCCSSKTTVYGQAKPG